MAFNLMLENGDKLLLENGNGIFLESYVAPDNQFPVSIIVSDPVVTCLLRINTPKFPTWDLVMASPAIVTVDNFVSEPPAKFLMVDVNVDEPIVNFTSGITVSTPRHLRPSRHYVWVHSLNGDQVNVLD